MNTLIITKTLATTSLAIFLFLPLTGCNSNGDGFLEPGMIEPVGGPETGSGPGPVSTNVPPVAKAGADQAVKRGTAVTLDGSQSYDPDGIELTYSWKFDSKPAESSAVLSDASSASPTFQADRAGTYRVSLVVSDGSQASKPDPPVANAGQNQNVNVGVLVTLDGSNS